MISSLHTKWDTTVDTLKRKDRKKGFTLQMHSQQKHDQSNKIHAVQEIQGRAGQTDYLSLCTLYNFIVEFHIQ